MLNEDNIIKDFPLLKNFTYLDSASTSLTPLPVINSINDYFVNYNSNISRGAYKIAIKANENVDESRENISKFLNTKTEEISFTKNTTEGINTIANGLNFRPEDNIIISNIEHHSNFLPWLNLRKYGIKIKIAEANNFGIIEPSKIEELIDDNTKLISISHVNNAIGSLQNIEKISEIAHDNNCLILIDGAQSLGHIPINIKKINPDFMAFPGHKGILGPVGTGFLYIKNDLSNSVEPQNLGGGTVIDIVNNEFLLEKPPYCFEGGTQNIAGIIGLNTAVNYVNRIGLKNIENYCSKLTIKLYDSLKSIENVEVYGKRDNIRNIVSFNILNMNPHDVSKILDETSNICVRSGHHCAIPTMNLLNAEDGTVRSSIHCYNNLNDIEKLINTIDEISKLS
ncbi:MAG: cysteine desulfurase [Methanobacteriaceae archaeon]|nr:cysteine desulfurase [Methanobacteriaceae archaeon]